MIAEGRSFSGRERNCCFLNTGASPAAGGRFANISAVSGLDFPDDGRAAALVDWDQDGDLDVWISNRNAPRLRLMRNELPRKNRFVALRLEGNGKSTNRDAIGARVEISLKGDERPLIKTLRAGEGFLAQSSKWLHYGLGADGIIDKVSVRWPGGEIEQFTGIDINRRYKLIQGTGTARDLTLPVRESKLNPSVQEALPSSQTARIPLIELFAMPRSHFLGFDGQQRQLPIKPGRLLLVNLWASWCPPCQTELSEFAERYDELRAKGIDILALSVDRLEQDPPEEVNASAASLVTKSKFPFPVGQATSQLLTDMQDLHDLQIPIDSKLPLPCSFLIDQQGRLAVIYKGAVSVDVLLKDADHSKGNRIERLARAAPIAGQSIRHPEVEQTASDLAGFIRFQLASKLQRSGRIEAATSQYADVLKLWPDSSETHYNLGIVMHQQGRIAEAMAHYRQALQNKPNYAEAYNGLGIALHGQGKIVEAIKRYRQALQHKTNYAKAHANLGIALSQQGNIVKAIEQYHQALRIDPRDPKTHTNLGVALNQQGRIAEAIKHLQYALQVDPKNVQAHTTLGLALSIQGNASAAIQQYTRALKLNQDSPEALNNLAWIHATHPDPALRDGARAVLLAERCSELMGQGADTLDTLAAAYAEAGRFDHAVLCQTKAVELAPEAAKAGLNSRLQLYKAGKPYREKR